MTAPFSDILVYLDGSEGSMTAAMYAVMLSKSTGARLHALYVINTKAVGDLVKAHVFVDMEKTEYLADLAKDSRRHLRHMEKLALSKDCPVALRSAEGAPHAEVMKYIKDNQIDLLLLGSVNTIHSRREELVSETDRMLRTSPCPVLVVKGDEEIWDRYEEI
jgi:Universal stress protein UspA and related nucleotide-binding proteins